MTRSDPVTACPAAQGAEGHRVVESLVVDTVAEMLRGQDRTYSGPMTLQTLLVADLDFRSLDVVMLIGALNRELRIVDLPFEQLLFVHGRPVADLSLRAVAEFLWEQSRAAADTSPPVQPR